MKPAEEQYEILSQGIVNLINKEDFIKKLKSKKPLVVKAGFDPSRPDLHLGHSLLINKLRQFQDLGHQVVFVVGDFTACIGDPSGQNKTRPVLSFEQSQKNALSYKQQATKQNFNISKKLTPGSQKVFEFFKRLDSEKTKLIYNSEWFNNLSLKDFILKISSQFTLARQLEREDFKNRYQKEKPIGLHELFYPLLQAYDSKELKADIEIGGTDQLFNLLLGRELQEKFQQTPQVVLTLPLLKGTITHKNKATETDMRENWVLEEGHDKMSKSLNNAISFNDSAKDMYGKVMSISDERLIEWWSLFTEGTENLTDLFKNQSIHPKTKKEELAWLLIYSFYGQEKADDIQKNFNETFKKNKTPEAESETDPVKNSAYKNKDSAYKNTEQENIIKKENQLSLKQGLQKEKENQLSLKQELQFLKKEIEKLKPEFQKISDLLYKLEMVSSKSEARRKIQEGAVKIRFEADNSANKITDPNHSIDLQTNKEFTLSLGKRKVIKINRKWEWIHDLKAYLVCRSAKDNKKEKNSLCEELAKDKFFKEANISISSIKMKLGNYDYLHDNKTGLKNASLQSKRVYEKYKNKTIEEIKQDIENWGKEQ